MKQRNSFAELPVYDNPLSLCEDILKTSGLTSEPTFENLTPTQLRKLFFINQRWRLRNEGYLHISKKFITYKSVNPSNTVLTGKIILRMDECVNSPWFIRGKEIIVFDPIIHFEIQMVNGDLNSFVDFKSTKS